MYNKKNQPGKVVWAIIIVIVVAVIGVFGAIAYRGSDKVEEQDTTELEDNTESENAVEEEEAAAEEPAASTVSEASDTATTTIPSIEPITSAITGDANLVITQWGVAGHYNGLYGISYLMDKNSASLTTADTPTDCQDRVLNSIIRYQPDDIITSHNHVDVEPQITAQVAASTWGRDSIVKIGEYYYVLEQGVTDVCPGYSSPENGVETNVLAGINNFFLTLKAQE